MSDIDPGLRAAITVGCWCKNAPKRCGYHEGYDDGWDAGRTIAVLEANSTLEPAKADWDSVTMFLNLQESSDG